MSRLYILRKREFYSVVISLNNEPNIAYSILYDEDVT